MTHLENDFYWITAGQTSKHLHPSAPPPPQSAAAAGPGKVHPTSTPGPKRGRSFSSESRGLDPVPKPYLFEGLDS